MNFPQVAILFWDEKKAQCPKYFLPSTFQRGEHHSHNITNGQLVLVRKLIRINEYIIEIWRENETYVAHSSNLIFLGSLE
jgi:hypothetical protein